LVTQTQKFVLSTGNMEVLLSHIHSIVCAYHIGGLFLKCDQGCIKCMRPPAMAMVQIENFCPFSDWLKNNLNFVLVTNPKTEILKTKIT
jgi:hypothetical protein